MRNSTTHNKCSKCASLDVMQELTEDCAEQAELLVLICVSIFFCQFIGCFGHIYAGFQPMGK